MGFLDIVNPVNWITTGVDLVDTLTGGKEHRARKQARYQQSLNEQSAENAFQREIQMWNMENEYNLPVNQLERYGQAGINPNAVIGQTSASGASPSSAPQASPTDYNGSVLSQYQKTSMMLDNFRKLAELKLIKSQTSNVDADTKNKEADTVGKDIENTYKPEILQNTIKGQNVTIDLQRSTNDLTIAQKDKVVKETEVLDANLNNIKEQTELLKENKKMLTQQIKNLLQQYDQNKQKFEKELSEIDSRIASNKAQAAVAYATAKYYAAQTTGQNLENHRRELYNTIYEAVANSEISLKRDQAHITHLMLNMITNDNEIYDLKMPALRQISPFMPYLDAGEKGIQVINGAFDVGSKQIDMATKPMQFGKDILNVVK